MIAVDADHLLVALLEELRRDLREHRVGQHILLLDRPLCSLGLEFLHLGLEGVGKPAGDRLLVAEDPLGELLADRGGGLAVVAMDQALELLGHHLVPLAQDDIEDRLGADDLAGRGDQRRVTGVLADTRDLSEHLVQLILLAGVLELLEHVGEHAARHLIEQGVGVDAQRLRVDLAVGDVLLAELCEVVAHDIQLVEVEAGVVVGAAQRGDQALGGHMGGAQRQRAHRGVDDVGARLDPLEDRHRGETRGVVAVDIHRDAQGLLELLDQVIAGIGGQQTGHILDADRVGAHLLEGLGVGGEILVVVHRGQGVADAALYMRALLVGRLDRGLQVARIVQRIKDTQNVDAICNGLLYKIFNRVIRIRTIAQHILAAEEHLQFLVGQFLAQDPQTLPRILIQKADAGIEGRAAPALDREVVDLIHFGQDGTHLIHRHTGGQQRLMGVAQHHLGNLDRFLSQIDSPPKKLIAQP